MMCQNYPLPAELTLQMHFVVWPQWHRNIYRYNIATLSRGLLTGVSIFKKRLQSIKINWRIIASDNATLHVMGPAVAQCRTRHQQDFLDICDQMFYMNFINLRHWPTTSIAERLMCTGFGNIFDAWWSQRLTLPVCNVLMQLLVCYDWYFKEISRKYAMFV